MRSGGKVLDFEEADPDTDTFGIGKVEDLTWKGFLDLGTCTECGRNRWFPLARLGHREGPVAQAAHPRPARPRVRQGPLPAGPRGPSETAMEIALNAVRIHGGYGYSTEFDVERYFRDAPLMIVGEGTNEIQRNVIARQLIRRHRPSARRRATMRTSRLTASLVVSLEQAVAAPFATRQLADLGARVIKIERPGRATSPAATTTPSLGQSSYFAWLNRGKESVELDLKSAGGRELLRRLIDRADVFVQNLAPGAADRLGLGAAALRPAGRS